MMAFPFPFLFSAYNLDMIEVDMDNPDKTKDYSGQWITLSLIFENLET